jgi:Na+-transporting methylmalonyl-CoA/oxaloacetate decarboxylase beta subunit
METSTSSSLMDNLQNFLSNTSFPHFSLGHVALIFLGFVLFYLAIKKEYEPLLLIPIGFGLIIGNIPFSLGFQLGITEPGSLLNQLFQGLSSGLYPALIFLE